MLLESINNEVLKEMDSVKHFIELAIEAQRAGYTKAALFFLGEARDDCEHSFLYARELDKHHQSSKGDKNIVEITKSYHDAEHGAIDRLSEMFKELDEEQFYSIRPFIVNMMSIHTEDCYKAKKILQKIEVLHESDSMKDIEDIFEEETDD